MRDSDVDVDDMIRRNMDVEVPPEVEARMRRRFAEFRARIERARPSPLGDFVRSLFHPASLRVPVAAAALVAVVILVIVFSTGSNAGRVYAAAATRLRAAQTLQYTVVIAPFVEVEFSYRAPGRQRVNCSWGIEIRTDESGSQLVIMHYMKSYVKEEGRKDGLAASVDLVQRLKALPANADAYLGEQHVDGRRLVGYRVDRAQAGFVGSGVQSLDIWVDARSGNPDHVDLTTTEAGKPPYQMHIKDIRVDAEIDPAIFDMIPPGGYAEIARPGGRIIGPDAVPQPQRDREPAGIATFRPAIKHLGLETAVVVPMKGSYVQAAVAVDAVESYLRRAGIAPVGPPFGRFDSEQRWDAGYPVPADTRVEPPFELVTLPAGDAATLIVKGPWGRDSTERWTRLFQWVVEQGYTPAGPPIEIWSGDEGRPEAQVTEMRIAVARAR